MKEKEETVRINLALSKSLKERIDNLIDLTDSSGITELLRQALLLYEEAAICVYKGGSIKMTHENGETVKYLIPTKFINKDI